MGSVGIPLIQIQTPKSYSKTHQYRLIFFQCFVGYMKTYGMQHLVLVCAVLFSTDIWIFQKRKRSIPCLVTATYTTEELFHVCTYPLSTHCSESSTGRRYWMSHSDNVHQITQAQNEVPQRTKRLPTTYYDVLRRTTTYDDEIRRALAQRRVGSKA